MRHVRAVAGSCWLAAALAVSPASLRAQIAEDAAPLKSEPSVAEPRSGRTPPRLVVLPPLSVPPGTEVPEDALQVTVAIDIEGRAVVEATVAEGELRASMDAVIAHARFVPATRDGVPVPARVSLRFAVEPSPAAPDATTADTTGPLAESNAPSSAARAAQTELTEAPAYGAVAEVDRPQPTARKLQLEEMREVPGAFGDPFRVLDTLPGVVPIFSGLPYVYVRGAPPAGTGYYYDGIAVPALFHLALGPAVVHPRMIGDLDFYPAVAPARYGRHIGGLFAAQGKHGAGAGMGAPDDTIHGELEWRVIDLQAMLDVPSDDTRLTVAGRYGYPGLLLTLLQEGAVLDYWDYQMRLSQRLSSRDRVVLTVFGSFDVAGDKNNPDDRLVLQFHRAETRLIRRIRSTEFGVALQGGYEKSQLGDSFEVVATRVGPRARRYRTAYACTQA